MATIQYFGPRRRALRGRLCSLVVTGRLRLIKDALESEASAMNDPLPAFIFSRTKLKSDFNIAAAYPEQEVQVK
jgi:hypothetical protein